MLDFDTCYAALQRRDPAADGAFFAAVRTTRIYCRPVCPARTPLRKNLSFHPTAAHAQAAGYRPCLRCRPETAPDSPAWLGSLASVNRALRLIEEGALAEMSGEALAERLGMTGRHLRRLFVQHLGVTPAAVEAARRVHLAKGLIHDTRLPMTTVAMAAGYGSLRRFNEAFLELFGRPPSALRREARDGEPAEAADAVLRLRLAYRPPLDWRGWLSRALSDARLEGSVLRASLRMEAGSVTLALRQGPGSSILVELPDTPIASLARVASQLKRRLHDPAVHWGAPDIAPAPTSSDAGNPAPLRGFDPGVCGRPAARDQEAARVSSA